MAAINAFASTAAIPIVGPVMAPAAATAAIAATSPMVGAVASLSLAGMAHDGIDSIPATGTWLLEKGERVTTAETSAKLDKTLSDIQSGGTGAPVVNLYEDASKAGTVSNRQENGQNVIDIFVSNIMSDGKAQQAISRKFGLRGVGQRSSTHASTCPFRCVRVMHFRRSARCSGRRCRADEQGSGAGSHRCRQ